VAGTDYDQINVVGTVTLNNPTLNLTAITGAVAPVPGSSMTLINNDGTDPIVGTFNNLPELSAVTVGLFTGTISYVGGSGNDVVLGTGSPFTFTENQGGANFVLRRNTNGTPDLTDDNLELLRNGTVVDTHLLSGVSKYTLNGQDGVNDTLQVDFAFGGFFSLGLGITFNGGTGGTDALSVIGGTFTSVTHNLDGPNSGRLFYNTATPPPLLIVY